MRGKLLVIACFFALFAKSATFQLCIELRDDFGSPVPEALVSVFGLKNYTGSTDDKGKVKFEVRKGYYHITIAHVAFIDTVAQARVIEDTCLIVSLTARSSTLGGVVVKAKKPLAKILTYQPNSIRVDAKDIKQFPKIAGETDPIRYVQLLPGVSFAHEGSADLNIRGGGKDQTMLGVNGMPIFAQEHLLGLYSTFSDKAIKNMTLSMAGVPAEYGSFGMSTLDFNYLTDSFSKQTSIKLGLLGNSIGRRGKSKNEKFHYNINARTSHTVFDYERLPLDFWDFSIGASYHLDSNNKLEFISQSSNDNFNIVDLFSFNFSFTKNVHFSQLNWHQTNSKNSRKSLYSLGYSTYAKVGASETFVSFEDPELLALNLNGQEWYNLSWKSEPLSEKSIYLSYGLQLKIGQNIERDHQYSEDLNYTVPFRFTRFSKSVLSQALLVTPFVEYKKNNENSYYRLSIRPNLFINTNSNSVYLPVEGTAAVGKLHNLSKYEFTFDRRTQLNHNLNPFLISNDLERWTFSNNILRPQLANQLAFTRLYRSSKINWVMSIYGKYTSNIYVYKDGANVQLSDFSEEVLPAESFAYGFETGFVYNTPVQTISLNYTYSKALIQSQGVNRGELFPADFDRPHSLKYFHVLRIRKHTTFSLNGILVSGRPLTVVQYQGPFFIFSDRNAYRLPFYKRIDIGFNHNRSFFNGKLKTEISYGAYNVFSFRNPFFVRYSGTTLDQNGFITSRYDFFNLMPIIPYFSLEVSF